MCARCVASKYGAGMEVDSKGNVIYHVITDEEAEASKGLADMFMAKQKGGPNFTANEQKIVDMGAKMGSKNP